MKRATKKLTLKNGGFTVVDKKDYQFLSGFNWTSYRVSGTGSNGKVYWYGYKAGIHVKGKRFWLHRMITNPAKGLEVDHRDGNTLNNTRDNLRIVTHAENCYNRGKRKGASSTSKYLGVCWSTEKKKYLAQAAGRFVGYFNSEITAARAADAATLKAYGDKARLNFPKRRRK